MILPNWGGLKLRAILADEWAEMKIKYKEIQKQNMRKLKQSLKVLFNFWNFKVFYVRKVSFLIVNFWLIA